MFIDAATIRAFLDAEKPAPCKPPIPTSQASKSYWVEAGPSPLASHGSTTPLSDVKQDVVVVGTGIAGISSLWHLVDGLPDASADRPRQITVLDARDFCSCATGRNGGLLCSYVEMDFTSRVAAIGLENARRDALFERRGMDFIAGLTEREGWDDVESNRDGVICLCDDLEQAAKCQASLRLAKANGLDVSGFDWLDDDGLRKAGMHNAAAALRLPGHALWPLRFVTHLFCHAEALARKKGHVVHLHTRTPALEVISKGDDCVVRTARGNLDTSYVVHATNGFASSLIPSLAHGTNAVSPTRAQIVTAVSPKAQPTARPGWLDHTHMYGQIRPDGNVLIGGHGALGLQDDSVTDDNVGDELLQYGRDHFTAFEPSKKSSSLAQPILDCLGWSDRSLKLDDGSTPAIMKTYQWTGVWGTTTTLNPYIGPLVIDGKRVPRQFINAGCNGHGMPRMPAGAEVTAKMLLADLYGKPPPTFEWLPDGYLMV